MSERDQSKFASILTLLLGIWVAISPIWISVTGGAVASVIATGSVIAVFSLIQYFWENTLPSWIVGLAAVWLFITTFAFGGVSGGAVVNLVISSVATFILAIWDGAEVSISHQHHVGAV
ncbi:MAG TPA: hypothetical protein VFH39_03040 [Candidatus Saccharimonadales bacterium]|nr:hypothetical protein [Candidatus Saccharimonadales bacterium]